MLGLAVMVSALFRFRAKQEGQITLRGLLSSSQEVSPEVLATLMEGMVPAPSADLRRGVISITLGIGLNLFALILGRSRLPSRLRSLCPLRNWLRHAARFRPKLFT